MTFHRRPSTAPVRRKKPAAGSRIAAVERASPREREAFFASISHELRTPLNAILGFNRLARADLPPQIDRSHLDHIDEAALVMLRVVNDLLDLAQLEAGRLEINPDQPLPLHEIFTRVGMLGAGLREDSAIRLYTVVDDDCPPALRGDPVRIEQVLINLLGNALKFTERGVVRMAARVRTRHQDRVLLRISVADTGAGIEMSDLERLGRPFERAVRAGGPSGSGLGLSVVRRLLDLHGTQLRVASVAGGGTIMWFDLELEVDRSAPQTSLVADSALLSMDPWLVQTVTTQWHAQGRVLTEPARAARWLVDAADPQAELHMSTARDQGRAAIRVSADLTALASDVIALPLLANKLFRPATQETLKPDEALRGLRVLVVEDNPLNQRVLGEFLDRFGVDSVLAADGHQALAALDGQVFDAALLDIRLPGDSGLQTARKMRALPEGLTLPLVFNSAHLSAADRLEAQSLQALACLSKPLDPVELRAALMRVPRPDRPRTSPVSSLRTSAERSLRVQFGALWPAQRALLDERTTHEALLQAVHALRGSLGVLGARRALQLARTIEEGLRAGLSAKELPMAELCRLCDVLAQDPTPDAG